MADGDEDEEVDDDDDDGRRRCRGAVSLVGSYRYAKNIL